MPKFSCPRGDCQYTTEDVTEVLAAAMISAHATKHTVAAQIVDLLYKRLLKHFLSQKRCCNFGEIQDFMLCYQHATHELRGCDHLTVFVCLCVSSLD